MVDFFYNYEELSSLVNSMDHSSEWTRGEIDYNISNLDEVDCDTSDIEYENKPESSYYVEVPNLTFVNTGSSELTLDCIEVPIQKLDLYNIAAIQVFDINDDESNLIIKEVNFHITDKFLLDCTNIDLLRFRSVRKYPKVYEFYTFHNVKLSRTEVIYLKDLIDGSK